MGCTALLSGRKRLPQASTKATPARTTAPVTGVNSYIPKDASPAARKASVTRMFGGVDMPVKGLPSRQPRAMRRRNRDGARPLQRASSSVAGSRMTATMVVLMSAESRLAVSISSVS